MTNRQKLGKMCIYDFLMMLDKNIEKLYGGCIKEALTGINYECDGKCDECMQKWLNEEAKNECK